VKPAILAIIALLLPQVAQAQDAPQVCDTLASVEAKLTAAKDPFVELDAKSLIGVAGAGLGKILVAANHEAIIFGYEINGCMSPPYAIARSLMAAAGA
jgi:hypothetical protein